MHIVQSSDWTAAVGSQQVSLESTGLCASLAALGHGCCTQTGRAQRGWSRHRAVLKPAVERRHAALTEDKAHSAQGVCSLWEGVCGSIIQ